MLHYSEVMWFSVLPALMFAFIHLVISVNDCAFEEISKYQIYIVFHNIASNLLLF